MKKGLFITFEGVDGCGKTTQMHLLADYLREQKDCCVVETREPGAVGLGEKIREILLNYDGVVSPQCEAFLFLADRAQNIDVIVNPAIESRKIVLCDRHTDSTVAYQGYGRGIDIEEINELNRIATRHRKPDLTLVFDIDIEEEGAIAIAKRSRGTPRIANRLVKRVRDFAIVKSNGLIDSETANNALDILQIDKFGLDNTDRALLNIIADKYNGGPVGIETLATALGEDSKTIEDVYEPYLVQKGFLQRTPRGRKLTPFACKCFNFTNTDIQQSLF